MFKVDENTQVVYFDQQKGALHAAHWSNSYSMCACLLLLKH